LDSIGIDVNKALCALLRGRWVALWLGLWLGNAGAEPPAGPAVATPGDTMAHAVQAVLREASNPKLRWGQFSDVRGDLETLYRERQYQPLWIHAGTATAQGEEITEALAHADLQGLRNDDYDGAPLHQALQRIQPATAQAEIAQVDAALSIAAARYAMNVYAGRINPRNVDYGLTLESKKLDVVDTLKRLAASRHPRLDLDALAPKLRVYRNLQDALARYRELAKSGKTVQLQFPAKFEPGKSHPDVPNLREILVGFGELSPEQVADQSPLYDETTAEAVKRFQRRHGIAPDGVIGKGTTARLNVPDSQRLMQIELGMERLRWLPDQGAGPYIMVNIPSFELFGFNDGFGSGDPDITMKVIVGEAVDGRRTPVFHSNMTYVVFRPHWNLPYKIAVKEMLPGALRNPGYLARNNIEIVSGFGTNAPVYAPSAENLQLVASGQLKLRQKPGPKNALGLVKFAFPNTNNVYLHSTPNQGLFGRDRRDFSHGCIRVADPTSLAEWVLRGEGEWTRERIQQAMNGKEPKLVTLKQPVPVYIFYSTVLADDQGKVLFYQDIYGHDRILQGLLDKGFPYPQ
jgi:murein L,D-transpeptidase YcbB/YkuD